MANTQALAKALIRANNAAATAGPGGFGGAPPSTMGPSPTVASYGEWAGGRAGYAGATYGLPREWEAFLSGSFGPLSPMRPIPIDAPPLGDDDRGPEPRRYTYPVSWNLPHGVPGDEGLKLASFSQLRTIADTYSVARACIQTRTQEIVGLDWSIVPTAEAEKAMRGDRAARKDFDERRAKLVKFFNRPDPGKYHNLASWLGALIEDILVVDAASLYLQPTRKKGKGVLGSNLGALCLIAGDTIRPMLDMHGGTPPPPNPAFQVYNFGVPRVDLMTVLSGEDVEGMSDHLVTQYRGDQLMYMPYVARSWTPYGFPAIERALVPILSGIQRQQWQLSYYGNGSVPGLFISAGDPNASPAQLRQLQDALNAMAGDPAWKHQIIVLPKDSKIDPMRATPLADQFDEMVMSQVCMSFDVMPMELGISPRTSTSQSSGAANQMSKASEGINERKALKPLLKWLKASIFDFVIQEVCGQSDIQWMWEGLEKDEDEQTQVNLLVNEVGHGLRSIDEARVARGEQAWGLPMTSIPVFFGAAGVTPIQPPAAPEPSPMPEGEPPPPGGEGEGSPPSSTTPTPTTPTPPSPTQPPQPADGGETPAHGGARAHVAETMRASDGGSAQADKPAPPPSNKMLTSEPVEVRSALRELDLIRRRLNKGRGLDDWTPEHVPVDVFAELVATYPQGVDKAVGYARAAVKTVAHRQRRDESCAHVQQRVVDGLHELAAGVGDGTVSTIGFVDAATALMRDAIRDGLGAGADHARVPVATKRATIPAKVDGLDGQFGLYAGAVPQAYEHGFGLVTLGAADDPDNIAIRWHAKPDACVLCGARDGQLFTVGTLPGWPGDGGFGKNATVCLGGPNCRCSLEYVHVTPDEMARVFGEQVPRSDASITSQTVQANASVTRDAHVAVAREAIRTGDPQMLDAVLDRIAETKAEAQRPFLMGLLQDILAALTRGAAALRTWLTTKGASNLADPNPVDAEHVAALMRANFPDDALGWVKDARWIGPVSIPQDRIDDDDMDSWAATRDKARVKHFAQRINDGDPPHPIIAVQEPGDTNIKVVDGHHRTLAYRKAGKPVPAYVGFVDADGGPWDETHAYQLHQGDHPANKASEHGHHVPGTPPKYSHGWVLRPESTASWTKVAGTDITENLDADSLAPASATVGKAEQMRTILDHQGFGGLPHVTDTKGLDDVVASGGQELFRGVASPDHAEQFRTGPLHISGQGEGDSSFGQGIYAGGIGVAQMFAGDDGVMRMALSPDARIVTQEDLRTERSQRSPKWTDAQRSLFFDDGRLAAALGYDAISYGPNPDPSERNYVVLNRTALTVQSGDSSIAAAVRRAHAKESVVSLRRWSRAAAKQDLRSKQKDELLALADLLQVEHGLAGVGELRAALLDALWPPANQVHQGDHPANKRDVSGEVRIPRGMPGGGRWVKVADWVHVGGHGVGDTVHHPEHGTGVVHEVGKTTTRVDFGGGNRLSFDRKTKVGASDHFAAKGPVGAPKPEPAHSVFAFRSAPLTLQPSADRRRPLVGGNLSQTKRRTIETALTDYGGNGYKRINASLRDPGTATAATERRVVAIDSAMAASSLTRDVVLYRATGDIARLFGTRASGDLTGAEWTDAAYVSTSVGTFWPTMAARDAEGGGIFLTIHVPAGVGAVGLGSGEGSGFDEGEILLDRGLRFRVTRDSGMYNGVRGLDVEVVPRESSMAAVPRKAAERATQGQLPVGRLDQQIANAESRVQVTRERLARAQDAFDAASRDPKVEALGEFFPLGTGGSGGGRRGSTDAQLRRYVEARKARDAARSQHVRAESQLRELTARRGAVGKYGRDTVSVGDAIKVKGTWWRVQKANDKTVQIDAGPGMEVKYRWDQVTDHRRVTVTPAKKAVPAKSAGRSPAIPVPIHDLFNADDAKIEKALRDVFEGKFGPYTTKVEVFITRAGARVDSRGREHKIEPSIGVDGKIYDATGFKIGYFGRSISPVALHYNNGVVRREVWAEHSTVQLGNADEDRGKYQGKGFGGEFNKRAIDWYRASNVHGISLSDHNGYVWASQGFNFNGGVVPDYVSESLHELVADLRAGKTKDKYGKMIPKKLREAPNLDMQIAAAEELLSRLGSTKPGQPGYPTAYEMSQLGRSVGQRGKTALWLGRHLYVPTGELILNPNEGEVVS